MKPINTITCFLALFLLFTSCEKSTNSVDESETVNCAKQINSTDSYKYPIVPGTPAWEKLSGVDERLNATQIPEHIVIKMSTEGLLQSWIDYPNNVDLIYADNLLVPINYFTTHFSGLVELNKRSDAAEKLLNKYLSISPSCVTSLATADEKVKFAFLFTLLELPLTQKQILNQLTLVQKKKLVKKALETYYLKKEYFKETPLVFSDLGVYLSALVMQQHDYTPFVAKITPEIKLFLQEGIYNFAEPDRSVEKSLIISHASNFIK